MDLEDVARLNADYGLLISYWRGKIVPPAEIPRRADLELMDLHAIAPRLVMIDVESDDNGQPLYKWRFSGTFLRDVIGVEMTGMYLHEVADAETARQTVEAYRSVVKRHEAHFWTRNIGIQSLDRSFVTYSRLILPLLGTGDDVEHMIGVYVFDETRAWTTTAQQQQWRFVIEQPQGG
ncbi:MAG: PAS domain-containing protein [Rhodospirillales bacterium]